MSVAASLQASGALRGLVFETRARHFAALANVAEARRDRRAGSVDREAAVRIKLLPLSRCRPRENERRRVSRNGQAGTQRSTPGIDPEPPVAFLHTGHHG